MQYFILILFILFIQSCKQNKSKQDKLEINVRSGTLSNIDMGNYSAKWGPYYFYKSNQNVTDSSKAFLLKKIPLNINRELTVSGFPDTETKFSPDENLLAIGTYFGELLVYSIKDNKILWKSEIPLGMIKKLCFSSDSKLLFVGEQSSDAYIYSYDAITGEEKWKYRTANDIKSSVYNPDQAYSIYSLPGVFHMTFKNNFLQVAALHSWFENGVAQKESKIYNISPGGKIEWQYPKTESFPANIKYFAINQKNLVFLLDDIETKSERYQSIAENSVVLLELKTGKYKDSKTIDILQPHFNSVYFWHSISINKSGNINFGAFDGRAFITEVKNDKLAEVKTLALGTPIEISGIPVSSGIPYTRITEKHAYFTLAQSSIPYLYTEKFKVNEPPSFHPEAGSLIATNFDGDIRWKFQNGLVYSSMHFNNTENLFIATIDNKPENRERNTFGFTLFEIDKLTRELYTYKTRFPVFFRGSISNSGHLVAITEANMDANEELVYQVHLVH